MNYKYISLHPLRSLRDKSLQIRGRVFKSHKPVELPAAEESFEELSATAATDVPPIIPEIPTQEPLQIDWGAMSEEKQREFFSANGFLGISQALCEQELQTIHEEIEKAGLSGLTENIWSVPSFPPLIENAKILAALRNIFGEDVRFFKGAYTDTLPAAVPAGRTTRTGYHVDYGGGETGGDFRNSCASWANVGIYLTDLTHENSPLWIVPGSHHYYEIVPTSDLEYMHDQARIVLANAGDAVIFHCLTVHSGGHNFSNNRRRALYLSYRPAWARHVGKVPEWPQEFIDNSPPERKKLLVGLNKGLGLL